jgi:hypothetical protein
VSQEKNVVLSLTPEEAEALDLALEFYIRLGLGQLSEIGSRLELLLGKHGRAQLEFIKEQLEQCEQILFDDGKPCCLGKDREVSAYTLTAFLIQSKLIGNHKGIKWAKQQLQRMGDANILPRE